MAYQLPPPIYHDDPNVRAWLFEMWRRDLDLLDTEATIALTGDVTAPATSIDLGAWSVPTAINLPNITRIDGGKSDSTYPIATAGPYGTNPLEGTEILSTGETGGTKFLREDGDGTCSWQAAGGGGAGQWVLLEDRATTAISEIDFTWDDTLYDEIRFECRGICGASGTDRQLKVQVGHTGGTVFYSTSGDYKGTYREFKDTTLSAHSTTNAHLCGNSVLNIDTSYGGMAGTIRIIAGSHDGSGCIIESRTTHAYGGLAGDILAYESKTYIEPIEKAIEIDSARFLWDGGAGVNFKVPGNIRMYGLKNS